MEEFIWCLHVTILRANYLQQPDWTEGSYWSYIAHAYTPASPYLPKGSNFWKKMQPYIIEKNKTIVLPFQLDSTLQYLPGTFQDEWRDSV